MAFISGQIPRDRWVSAEGSDANPGTRQAPWATIPRVSAASLEPGAVIYFRGGDTFFGQLTGASDGIKFRTFGTGRASFSGGVPVTTWTLVDVPKNIWRASFAASTGRPRAIWVNNLRCTRSRTTSLGTMTPTATGYNSTFLASAINPADVELTMRFAFWSIKKVQVTAATATTITISAHVKDLMNREEVLFNAVAGGSTVPFEAENIYEVFVSNHTQATFYQDRTNNFLYLVPPTGISDPNSASVIAGVRENVISLANVSDVTFENIDIRHTTTLRPYHADAYIDGQTGGCFGDDFALISPPGGGSNWVGTMTTMEAAVKLDTCVRVKFIRPVFAGMGGLAYKQIGACSACELDGHIFNDCGASAIQIGEPGYTYTQLQTTPVVPQLPQPTLPNIHDGVIQNCGLDFISHGGVLGWWYDHLTLRHNIIRKCSADPVALGWGFGYYEANFLSGDLIEYNEVEIGMGLVTDGGGIYLNGISDTTRTTQFNWVHDISGSYDVSPAIKAGIYLDGGAYQNLVQGNVVNTVEDAGFNLNSDDNGSSKDVPRVAPRNTVINNVTDNATFRTDGSGGQNTISGQSIVSTGAAQAAGAALGCGPRAGYEDVIAAAAALL